MFHVLYNENDLTLSKCEHLKSFDLASGLGSVRLYSQTDYTFKIIINSE